MLQDWDEGSIWFKDMSTANHVNDCTNVKALPNVVPVSDFGQKLQAPLATPAEISAVKAKAKIFFNEQVSAMNEHPDTGMVNKTRNQSLAYRLEQTSVYETERLSKVEEQHTKTLVTQQERQ